MSRVIGWCERLVKTCEEFPLCSGCCCCEVEEVGEVGSSPGVVVESEEEAMVLAFGRGISPGAALALVG